MMTSSKKSGADRNSKGFGTGTFLKKEDGYSTPSGLTSNPQPTRDSKPSKRAPARATEKSNSTRVQSQSPFAPAEARLKNLGM